MVHYLRLRGGGDGGAEYGCRFVRTRSFAEEERAGKRLALSLVQPPQPGPILRGMASKGIHWARPDAPYWRVLRACVASAAACRFTQRLRLRALLAPRQGDSDGQQREQRHQVPRRAASRNLRSRHACARCFACFRDAYLSHHDSRISLT
jgi:hypothetical protein